MGLVFIWTNLIAIEKNIQMLILQQKSNTSRLSKFLYCGIKFIFADCCIFFVKANILQRKRQFFLSIKNLFESAFEISNRCIGQLILNTH